MKSFSKLAMLGFIFLALFPVDGFSQQVIEDDAVLFGPFDDDDAVFGDYEVGLAQTTSVGGGDDMGLFAYGIDDLGDNQFLFNFIGIAELNALYFAEPGAVVDPSFANNTTPFASNTGDGPDAILTLEVGESVFFGYWDDRSEDPSDLTGADNIANGFDNYGWFELGRSNREDLSFGNLEILGGATAIGSGIIAGTTTTVAIPEPSSAIVIGLLGAFGLVRRRNKRSVSR